MTGTKAQSCKGTKSKASSVFFSLYLCAFVTLCFFLRLEFKMEGLSDERV
jgi:hypothetical protein